jgi:hypothetical protein
MAGSGFPKKQVVSASRRTDIPAFYMDWFMDQIFRGCFHFENPYSRKVSVVPVSPENTDTLVFWSKNFKVFLDGGYGEALIKMGYHLFFNFTINSFDPILEPHVPDLGDRLVQLQTLVERFGPETVTWRFDPICHYSLDDNNLRDNLNDFSLIAAQSAKAGIKRCVTSFVDLYAKVTSRGKLISGFSFVDIPLEKKRDIILNLNKILSPQNIGLFLCCERDLFQSLPLGCGIEESSCIPNPLLGKLSGCLLSKVKDSGQRKAKGCGCYASRDIGSYRLQPCYHNCLFCYANPVKPMMGNNYNG